MLAKPRDTTNRTSNRPQSPLPTEPLAHRAPASGAIGRVTANSRERKNLVKSVNYKGKNQFNQSGGSRGESRRQLVTGASDNSRKEEATKVNQT